MRLRVTPVGASWIDRRIDGSDRPAGELTLTAGPPANGGSCVARHDGRVVFVRYALPGETVRGAGDRRPRILLARRRCRGARSRRPTGSSRCARSPASTAPAAAIWRSSTPEAARALKGARGGQPAGAAGRIPLARRSRRVAEPVGTGGRDRLAHPGAAGHLGADGRAGFPPLPQRGAGHRPALRAVARRHARRPDECGWPPGAHLHVALDDDGARHVVQSGPRIGRRDVHPGRRGQLRGDAARRGADVAGAGDGVLAGPPRRGAGVQRAGGRVGAARPTAWRRGICTAAQGFSRRCSAEAVGDSGQVVDRRHLARRVAVGAGRAGRSEQCVGGHRLGAPGACRLSRGAPTWRCWTRRGRVRAAR